MIIIINLVHLASKRLRTVFVCYRLANHSKCPFEVSEDVGRSDVADYVLYRGILVAGITAVYGSTQTEVCA